MQDLLTLLAEHNRIITADAAVITQNYTAMNTMANDILADMKRRGYLTTTSTTGPSA